MNKALKRKKAVSPVIATVILIGLVVMSSAMIYFIVVPMLEGDARAEVIRTQWFDSKGDDVADVVYLSIQNVGTARVAFDKVNITITNSAHSGVLLPDTNLVGNVDLGVEIGARLDITVEFDASEYLTLGENIFRIRLYFDNETFIPVPENLRYSYTVQPLALTVLNPLNNTWYSIETTEILSLQAVATGGYVRSTINYSLYQKEETGYIVVEDYNNKLITQNINGDIFEPVTDVDTYRINFTVTDEVGQEAETIIYFGNDREDPYVPPPTAEADGVIVELIGDTYQIRHSNILDEEVSVDFQIGWAINDSDGASIERITIQLVNTQTSTLEYERVLLSPDDLDEGETLAEGKYTIQEEHLTLPGDYYNVYLIARDEAGNQGSDSLNLFILDDVVPECAFSAVIVNGLNKINDDPITLEGIVTFTVLGTDLSGLDDNYFILNFYDENFNQLTYFDQRESADAEYNIATDLWTLEYDTTSLSNDVKYVETRIRDNAGNINPVDTTIISVIVDNPTEETGLTVTSIENTARKQMSVTLKNLLGENLEITKVIVGWTVYNNNGVEAILVDGVDYSPPGTQGAGEIILTSSVSIQGDGTIVMRFNYHTPGNSPLPDGSVFTYRFVYEVGEIEYTTEIFSSNPI